MRATVDASVAVKWLVPEDAIACARRTGSILVTADRGLARAVSKRVSDVQVVTLDDRNGMKRVEAAGFPGRSSV